MQSKIFCQIYLTFVKFVLHLVNQTLQIMKSRFLFPHQSRIIGYVCIFAYIPVMVIKKLLHDGYNNQTPAIKFADASGLLNSEHILAAIGTILILSGLLFIAFSKEKVEDEQISQLRLDSLQWAIYFNYFILICTVLFTSNMNFRDIIVINLWTPLIFFIVRFRWVIFRLNLSTSREG